MHIESSYIHGFLEPSLKDLVTTLVTKVEQLCSAVHVMDHKICDKLQFLLPPAPVLSRAVSETPSLAPPSVMSPPLTFPMSPLTCPTHNPTRPLHTSSSRLSSPAPATVAALPTVMSAYGHSSTISDDLLSVLSDCFSESSVVSASNFGSVAASAPSQAPVCNAEAKVKKWVVDGYSARIPVDLVLSNPNNEKYKTPRQVRKIASLLARHSFFGERTLALCSVTGKVGHSLNPAKMAAIKKLVREMVPSVSPTELEEAWALCVESIKDLSKRSRQQLKQYNLMELAARYEGVDPPKDN